MKNHETTKGRDMRQNAAEKKIMPDERDDATKKVVSEIVEDAKKDSQEYLKDTIVPEGGE